MTMADEIMIPSRGLLWSDEEVKALIEIWSSNTIQQKLSTSKRNVLVYVQIAKLLNAQQGVGGERTRTSIQCREKIKKLKAAFRAVEAGRAKHECPFYDMLVPVLSNRTAGLSKPKKIQSTSQRLEQGCSQNAVGLKRKWSNVRDAYTAKQRKEERKAPSWTRIGLRKRPLGRATQLKNSVNAPFQPHVDDEEELGTPDMSENESDRSSVASEAGHQRAVSGQDQSQGSAQREADDQQTPSLSQPAPRTPAKRACHSHSQQNHHHSEDNMAGPSALHRGRSKQQSRFVPEDRDGDDAFFQSCALRMKNMSAQTRSFLRLQITQLFVNAENPDIAPLPITPLPGGRSGELNVHANSFVASVPATSLPLPGHQQNGNSCVTTSVPATAIAPSLPVCGGQNNHDCDVMIKNDA